MPFLIEREPQGYFLHLPKIFYGLKIYAMQTEKIIRSFYGTKRCLYLHQWMNATTRLKSLMKRFDNLKWYSTLAGQVARFVLFFASLPITIDFAEKVVY